MKLSIALASYNGERFIGEQLQSFLEQTRHPDEVVISDDASTDRTLEIVEAFRAKAPFHVKLIRGRGRQGFVANFNRALEHTTGDLVFLSDQDDVWFPRKIEVMAAKAVEQPGAWVLMCDAALTDERLQDVGITKLDQIRAAGLPMTYFAMGCCAVVRRQFLDLCLPIPSNFKSHDVWLVKIADGLGRKYVAGDVLQYYRRHGSNTSAGPTSALVRINRYAFYRRQMGELASRNSTSAARARQQLRDIRMLGDGVIRAARDAPPGLREELRSLVRRWEGMSDSLGMRIRLRQRSRVVRGFEIARIWRSGGYGYFSGVRSVVRDLLFR